MRSFILLLAIVAAGADFRTKPETRGRVTTWLDVTIAKPKEPGLAEVTLVVSVEGPPELVVQKSGPVDPVGWTVTLTPQRQRIDDKVHWTQTVTLQQTKPGRLPLPAIKVTFRDGPEAPWETVAWTDLLRQVRGLPEPVQMPEPPAPFEHGRKGTTLVLLTADVLLLARVVWMRWPRRRQPPLTSEQRLARELDAATILMATDVPAAHERLADTVRGFFAERYHVQAAQQTTAEFLEALDRDAPTKELRDFFERCDLVKFAGVRPTAEECRRTAEMARRLISFSRGSVTSPPTPSLRRGAG